MEFFFLWLSVAIVFFLIELLGVSLFFFLSFALGAFATAIISLLVLSGGYQVLFFLGVSVIAFILLRVVFNPHKYHVHATNIDRLPGMHGLVVKTIVPGMSGQVKVEGQIWSARAVNPDLILEGVFIEVVRVQGSHVIVRQIAKE